MTLTERVEQERRALRWRSHAVHAAIAMAVLLLVLAVGAGLLTAGRWLVWPRAVPFAVWGIGAGMAWLLTRWAARRLPAPSGMAALSHGIEVEQGLRHGALRGALELQGGDALMRRAVADIEARLAPEAVLLPAARQLAGRRLVGAASAVAVAAGLLVVVSVRARDGAAAVLRPFDAWSGRLLPALAFEGLPTEVPRGMPLTVRVRAEGRTAITVAVRTAGEGWREAQLVVEAGQAVLPLPALRAPVTVRVDDGRSAVLEREIAVADRGWLGEVTVDAVYPAYLARPSERLELGGELRVPRGTQLRVQASAHSGARAARLVAERSVSAGAAPDSVLFAALGDVALDARFEVAGDATWAWRADAMPGDDGITLPVELPAPLVVTMIPDAAPAVLIHAPASDSTVSASGRVTLLLEAIDDHALADVSLLVQRERADGQRDPATRLALAAVDAPLWEGEATLTLDGRGLEPGDRLLVVAQAVDASPWRQRGESRRLVLRVPSTEEQRALARALADSLMARANALAEAERALQRSTSEAARSRDLQGASRTNESGAGTAATPEGARSASMSFEQAEQIKQLAQQQREMGERVNDLKDGARELEQRLSDAGAMDRELAQRFADLQKLLRDALTPEMQQQLAELERASDRLSGTEVRQSLEQLAEQQRQMREQLERSADMLKRAALEGAMETLRDEAQDLARAERELAEQLAGTSPRPDASGAGASRPGEGRPESGAEAQQARDLARRSERLERDMEALSERLRREGAPDGANKTQEAQPDVQSARDAMQQAAEQLAGREARPAGQPQGGQPQAGQRQPGQPQGGQPQGGPPQAGQPQGGQSPGGPPQPGDAAEQAQRAAEAMERAVDQLAAAREAQVEAWKQDLSQQLDQTINETAQLARQQQQLADQAQRDGFPQGLQGEQGALQQGVQQAAERLEQAGRGSSLLSQRSQRSMAEAQQKVQQATQAAGAAGQPGGAERAEGAMRDAAQALNQALASMVRDRERVNSANSASGFSEMLEQMKELAQQQGSLNGEMQGLQLLPGGPQGQQAQQQARALARQQREVAEGLQDVSDLDPTGRLEALAQEAQQVAQALDRGAVDPAVAARQQQLYRRLLDAGRFMEQEQRDDRGPRESRAADGRGSTRATGVTSGRDALRFQSPDWNDLRGLSADERRLVSEYFRRLNGSPP
jgi:hypothetical protein